MIRRNRSPYRTTRRRVERVPTPKFWGNARALWRRVDVMFVQCVLVAITVALLFGVWEVAVVVSGVSAGGVASMHRTYQVLCPRCEERFVGHPPLALARSCQHCQLPFGAYRVGNVWYAASGAKLDA